MGMDNRRRVPVSAQRMPPRKSKLPPGRLARTARTTRPGRPVKLSPRFPAILGSWFQSSFLEYENQATIAYWGLWFQSTFLEYETRQPLHLNPGNCTVSCTTVVMEGDTCRQFGVMLGSSPTTLLITSSVCCGHVREMDLKALEAPSSRRSADLALRSLPPWKQQPNWPSLSHEVSSLQM